VPAPVLPFPEGDRRWSRIFQAERNGDIMHQRRGFQGFQHFTRKRLAQTDQTGIAVHLGKMLYQIRLSPVKDDHF